MLNIAITTDFPELVEKCITISKQFSIPFLDFESKQASEFILKLDPQKLVLIKQGLKTVKPLFVDFSALQWRKRQASFSKNELLAKAIGIKKYGKLEVLDTTAGLGRDGFLLAQFGCEVTLLEKNPVVFLLLEDGLRRYATLFPDENQKLNYHLYFMDAIQFLKSDKQFDTIYLDPMFPERKKTALVKKEMQFLHDLVETDEDHAKLLALSLSHAKYRVVVKRPLHAKTLTERNPDICYKGKTIRYDIYFGFSR